MPDTKKQKKQKAAADLSAAERRKQKKADRILQKQQKKELKELRREYERRSKLKPQSKRPLICPPDRAASDNKTIAVGFAVRAFIIFVAVFALTYFICEGYGLIAAGVSGWMIAGAGLLFTAILTLTCVLPRREIAVPVGIVLLCGIAALLLLPDPVRNGCGMFASTYNAALNHLTDVGYLAMNEKVVENSLSPAVQVEMIRRAVTAFELLLSAVLVPCLIRRIGWKIVFPAALSALGLWSVFVFNISRSNWGVALIIASFSALLVMFAYDLIYIRKPNPDKYDTETCVFGSEQEPELPRSILDARAAKAEAKKAKAERKEKRRALKKAKKNKQAPTVTVDEELSDYFGKPQSKKKQKKSKEPKAPKKKLTPAEKKAAKAEKAARKAAAKQQKREETAALRRVRDFRLRQTDAKCAMGGFAGAGMFALAFLMLLLPALTTHSSFHTIEAIDKKMEFYRDYVTAWLMGDDPVLDLLAYEGDPNNFTPRSTDPAELRFYGTPLMKVDANTRQYNIYLRGWIGVDYDPTDGTWHTATSDSEAFSAYRALFGTAIDPSELMMYNFYNAMDSESVPLDRDYVTKTKSNTGYGFVISQVNMQRLKLESKLLYMPSYYLRSLNVSGTTKTGKNTTYMRTYGGDEASKITYANYFDGIYTSYRAASDEDGYAAVSMITTMRSNGFYHTVADMIAEFNRARTPIKAGQETIVSGADNQTVVGYVLRYADGSTDTYKVGYVRFDGDFTLYDTVETTLPDGTVEYTQVENTYVPATMSENITFDIREYVKKASAGDSYTVIMLEQPVGTAVYVRADATGTITKGMTGIPEDKKLNAEGEEIRYIAPELPFAIRYFELMTDAERGALTYDYTVSDYYTNYVYDTYTKKSGSAVIADLAKKIIADARTPRTVEELIFDENGKPVYIEGTDVQDYNTYTVYDVTDYSRAAEKPVYEKVITNKKTDAYKWKLVSAPTDEVVYEQRHMLVMEFIDYLKDNYTYTLTPKLSANESLVGVEKFLADTHEGYCVQFATSLTLMLREAGIPARFCDGYVATDFRTNYNKDKIAAYSSTVRDNNAHAWVEVWFDGIGWVQYEATPEYYDDMYKNPESEPSHVNPGSDVGEDDTGEDDIPELTPEQIAELIRQQEEEERKARIAKIIKITVTVVCVAAAIAVLFFVVYRFAKAAQKKRDDLVDKFAAVGRKDNKGELPTREEVRQMSDLIELLMKECGLAPKTGEFRDEYAVRLVNANRGALASAVKEEKLTEFEAAHTAMEEKAVTEMLDGMAAEEFGYGAPASAMPLMARFYRRMYNGEYRRHVNPVRRLWLWLFAWKL